MFYYVKGCLEKVNDGIDKNEEATKMDSQCDVCGGFGESWWKCMCSDSYESLAAEVGRLTDEKGRQYGNASGKVEAMMKVLYPEGVPVHALRNALLITRMLDKHCRIANQGPDGKDKGGEDPWMDIAGYALIGLKQARGG